jgi:hypothetical protein
MTVIHIVMAGHSRSKNGVASLAYVPAIHAFFVGAHHKTWMPGTRPGMTSQRL